MKITKKCLVCGEDFTVKQLYHKAPNRRQTCSHECSIEYSRHITKYNPAILVQQRDYARRKRAPPSSVPSSAKSDDVQLSAIFSWLTKTAGIPPRRVLVDHFVAFSRYDYSVTAIQQNMTLEEVRSPQHFTHRPDIIIIPKDGANKIDLIVELDGSVHDTKSGRRKTERRNRDYEDAKLPYFVINITDCAEAKLDWFEILERELKKRKLWCMKK